MLIDEGLHAIPLAKFQHQVMRLLLGVLAVETAGHDDPRPILFLEGVGLGRIGLHAAAGQQVEPGVSAREIAVACMPSTRPRAAIRNAHFPFIANSILT